MNINRERWPRPSMDLGQSAQSDKVRLRSAVLRQPHSAEWGFPLPSYACSPSVACLNKRLVLDSKVFIFHERLFIETMVTFKARFARVELTF